MTKVNTLMRINLLRFMQLCWFVCAALLVRTTGLAAPVVSDFAFAQPQLETIGDTESIPEGVVTALVQDANGFIWIGTHMGLIRYDGYRFRKFSHHPNDPASLAGDYVYTLWAARDGRVWLGTYSDGLAVFDPASQRFDRFTHDAKQPDSLSSNRIWAVVGDANGGIWVATDQSLDYLPPNGRTFVHYRQDATQAASPPAGSVRTLLVSRAGRLWLGGVGVLLQLAEDRTHFKTLDHGHSLNGMEVRSLFEAQDGKLWVGTRKHGAAWLEPASAASASAGRLHWLDLDQTGSVASKTLTLSHGWISGIAQAKPDQIWLASYGGGINIVAANDGRVLQHLRRDQAVPGSLALDSIKPLLLDRSGLLWIGSWGGGLQRFNTNNAMVRVLRHRPGVASGLSHPSVTSVLELADGKILFGTDGNGIDIFDRERGLVGGYRVGPAGGLPDGVISTLAQTADGSIWVSTRQGATLRRLPGSARWQAIATLPLQQIRKFLPARDGSLWAATNRGIARWRASADATGRFETGRFETGRFETLPDEYGKPMDRVVNTLAEDGQGRIWAGSNDGLWVLAPGAQGWHGIRHEPGRSDSLISDDIASLLVDRRGSLWLSTDKGLERMQYQDGKPERFEHINARLGQTEKGLGGNLLEDQAGRIWLQLAVIDPIKMAMTRLSKADGIDAGSTWALAQGQTRDGLLFSGGSQGVVIINPALFQPWLYAPPLVLTELKINGKAAPTAMLAGLVKATGGAGSASLPGLTLAPQQNNFALEFAALDFSEPKMNRYQYRLQGYDSDWIDTDFEHRIAAWSNLWPGEYVLQVRGSNRLGQWSDQELNLPIRVLPAFWQTGWFWLLALLAFFSAVFWLHRWRTTRLKALIAARTADLTRSHAQLSSAHLHLQQTQEKLVQAEKMAALGGLVAGIAHEINTPLGTAVTAISGATAIWQQLKSGLNGNSISKSRLIADTDAGLEYSELALRSATRAADLVNTFKTIAVQVADDQVSEIEFARYLPELCAPACAALEALGCQVEITVEPDLRMVGVADALSQALIQILANVQAHAFAAGLAAAHSGRVCISAQREDQHTVLIEVKDNGAGIAPQDLPKVFDPFFTTRSGAGGHVGLGLHVAFNHITQRLKGEITIASTLGQGCTVSIRLKATP